MSTTRSVSPGKSRRCPHCRSEILESASVCPVCRHHLKFGKAAELPGRRFSALHVEGTVRHPADADPWEYSVVVSVRNQKGEEVARHVVGIGSMHGNDLRTFDLSVDVFAPDVRAAMPPPETPTKVTTASTAIKSSTVSAARIVASAPRTPVGPLTRTPLTPAGQAARTPSKPPVPPSGRPPPNGVSASRPANVPPRPPPKKPTDR